MAGEQQDQERAGGGNRTKLVGTGRGARRERCDHHDTKA